MIEIKNNHREHRLALLRVRTEIHNGLIACVREIAACTEQYWYPIKHLHARNPLFFDYGDAEGYRHDLHRNRRHGDRAQ